MQYASRIRLLRRSLETCIRIRSRDPFGKSFRLSAGPMRVARRIPLHQMARIDQSMGEGRDSFGLTAERREEAKIAHRSKGDAIERMRARRRRLSRRTHRPRMVGEHPAMSRESRRARPGSTPALRSIIHAVMASRMMDGARSSKPTIVNM